MGRKRGEEKEKRLKIRKKRLGKPAEAGGEQARLWGELGNHSSPPHGAVSISLSVLINRERGGKQPSLPFISRLKNKHPLPLDVRAGKAGTCFTAACWLAENKQNNRG